MTITKEEAIERIRQLKAAAEFYVQWVGNAKPVDNNTLKDIEAFNMAIEALERYDSEGYWENREHVQVDEGGYDVATCSICGSEITLEYPYDNYCPNCGADMRKGGDLE